MMSEYDLITFNFCLLHIISLFLLLEITLFYFQSIVVTSYSYKVISLTTYCSNPPACVLNTPSHYLIAASLILSYYVL